MKQIQTILNHNVSSIVEVSAHYQCNLFSVTFQSLSNDNIQNIYFMSENKTFATAINVGLAFYFTLF